jgi:hypothetical protein
MTIDAAIRIADIGQAERDLKWGSTRMRTEFYMLCSTALRLAKYMNGVSGLAEETGKVCSELQDMENPDCWQERMKREYRETKERYEKLHRIVTKYEAGVLEYTPKCSIELLKQQKKHMGEYLHDLEVGAFVEGVEL